MGFPLEIETLTVEAPGQEWIEAKGGEPTTVQQHENSVRFPVQYLPEGIAAG